MLRTPSRAICTAVLCMAICCSTAYCQHTDMALLSHSISSFNHSIPGYDAASMNEEPLGSSATVISEKDFEEKDADAFINHTLFDNDYSIMILQIPSAKWGGAYTLKVSANTNQYTRVHIIDMKGKLIRRFGIKRNGTITFENNLNPGNYMIEVIQGNATRLQRLIKK